MHSGLFGSAILNLLLKDSKLSVTVLVRGSAIARQIESLGATVVQGKLEQSDLITDWSGTNKSDVRRLFFNSPLSFAHENASSTGDRPRRPSPRQDLHRSRPRRHQIPRVSQQTHRLPYDPYPIHAIFTPLLFLHIVRTSGAGVIADNAAGAFASPTTYTDLEPETIDAILPLHPFREIDVQILDMQKALGEDLCKVAIVMPPLVYGYHCER